jgi:18S rRNA (guanine1575-N7)-methyltransferase
VLEEHGHVWVGCDVSRDMLNMANERIDGKREAAAQSNEDSKDDDDDEMEDDSSDDDEENNNEEPSTGDLLHHDMGTGLPFRPASFDACISIRPYNGCAIQTRKNRYQRDVS